jgi:hypothetical protein
MGDRNVTPFLARTLTWAEVANCTSIAFDLRIAALVARAADTFVALRPNGRVSEPEGLVENLLFGAGRHLFLVPDDLKLIAPLENVVVAWNGSRESARALAESFPYLHQARKVGVLVVEGRHPTEADALMGNDAVHHLRHHGINAVKYIAPSARRTRLPTR